MTTDLGKRAHDVTIYSDFHAITCGKSSFHPVWELPLILIARAINRPDPILPSVPSFYDGLSNLYSRNTFTQNIPSGITTPPQPTTRTLRHAIIAIWCF